MERGSGKERGGRRREERVGGEGKQRREEREKERGKREREHTQTHRERHTHTHTTERLTVRHWLCAGCVSFFQFFFLPAV